MVMGVCGGLGLYFGIDPTIIRIFFVVFTLAEGFGVLLYILLAIFMPMAPAEEDHAFDGATFNLDSRQIGNALGIGLVLIGGVVLLDNLHVAWLSWVSLKTIFPAALVLLGVYLLVRGPQHDV